MLYPRGVSKRAALLDDARPAAPPRSGAFGVASLTTATQHVVTHSGSPSLCYTRGAFVRPPPSLKMHTHLLRSGVMLANLLHSDGASSPVYAVRRARLLAARHVARCAWSSAPPHSEIVRNSVRRAAERKLRNFFAKLRNFLEQQLHSAAWPQP